MAGDVNIGPGGPSAIRLAEATASAYTTRELITFVLLAVVCVIASAFIGHALGVPSLHKVSPSLLRDPSPVVAVLTAVLCIAVCAAIGTLVGGRVHYDAGIFASAMGLAALSARGGPIGPLLRTSTSGRGAYGTLLVELLLLSALLLLIWWALRRMLGSRLLRDDAWLAGEGDPGEGQQSIPLRDNVQSTATQALVLIILMMLFARTDAKKQIIPIVGVGSFIATLLAYHFSPTRGGVWYWAGPLVVGVLGYAYAFVSPGAWFLGIPPQSLASPIPLDYAGPGVAGAIVGYWTSRRWQRTHEHADDSPTSTPAPS